MRAAANFLAPEVTKRLPIPSGATRLLDIGGSHGYYSVSLCRRHASLSAEGLELPNAIAAAAPILARENMGARVVHRAGDALREDLGTSQYDVILVSDLLHHFDAASNRDLVERCARALTPGGMVVLKDTIRGDEGARPKQMPMLGAMGVSMISESNMWSVDEMQAWLADAGLKARSPIFLRAAPGVAMVVGQRS